MNADEAKMAALTDLFNHFKAMTPKQLAETVDMDKFYAEAVAMGPVFGRVKTPATQPTARG